MIKFNRAIIYYLTKIQNVVHHVEYFVDYIFFCLYSMSLISLYSIRVGPRNFQKEGP